jgi:hypothetical protein
VPAADTSFLGSMFGGMTGSDKALVLSGAATLLGKAFGGNDGASIEVAKIQSQSALEQQKLKNETDLKTGQMQVDVADRKLAAEKELNAQKFENMNYRPEMSWEVGDKKTGQTKKLGSSSVISKVAAKEGK